MAAVIVTDTEDDNPAGGNIVLTKPTVATGDLLVAHLSSFDASSPQNPALPTGFTGLTDIAANGGLEDRTCWRVVDGSEGSSFTSTVAGGPSFTGGKLLHITGVNASDVVEATNTATGTGTSVNMPAVTAGADACLAVAFVSTGDQTIGATPTGWTLYDSWGSGFGAVYYRSLAAGASSGTASQAFAGSTTYAISVAAFNETPVAPAAPTDVRVTEVRDGSALLAWTNPAGTLTGRVIEYAAEPYPGASLSWTSFENSSTTTASATVTGLTNGTRYVFRVALKNSVGTGTAAKADTGATPAKLPWVVGVGASVSATTGTATPTYPAGYTAVAGDTAIIVVAGRPTGTTEAATPSGYAVVDSVLQEIGANDLRLQAFSKVLTASEAQPAITVPSGWTGTSAGMSVRVMIVRDLGDVDVASVDSSGAAAATFRPTGLTTLTANDFVLTVVATGDDNTLIFDATTSPASHQNFVLDAAHVDTAGGDHAVAIAHRLGAIPAISTQASTADPLTAAFQDSVAPTDTGDFQYLRQGSGGRVFILDGGVRTSHDEFTGRTTTWVPSGSGWTASNDSVPSPGHGTGVASIAAGDTLGVARAAEIVVMKMHNTTVTDQTPTVAHFEEALQWIVANYDPPYFVNWSLEGPELATEAADYADYEDAIDTFAAAGGVIICAIGNFGGDITGYMPDDHPATYLVAGHTFAGAKDASSSQWSRQAISAMYGSHTTASNAGDSTTSTGRSGTSFAAPMVTGTAAVISAANPSLTAAQVMDLLIRDAPQGLTGFPAGYSTRKLYSNADIPGLVGVVSPPLFRQSTNGNDAWAAFTVAFKPEPNVVSGTAAATFTLTATAVGQPRTPGTAAATFALTATSTGVRRTAGTAANSFALTATVAGTPRKLGTAAASFTLTATALGEVDGSDTVTGTAAATYTLSATAAGSRNTPGAAAATFTLTASAAGVRRASGTAAASYALTATATAQPGKLGTAAASFALTATATGTRRVYGSVSATYTLTAHAVGTTAGVTVGQAAATFTLTATAAGGRETFATASASYTLTATSSGVPETFGLAAASFTLTASASATPRRPGTAAASFTLTATAAGTVTHTVTGTAAAVFLLLAHAQVQNVLRPTTTVALAAIPQGAVVLEPIPSGDVALVAQPEGALAWSG